MNITELSLKTAKYFYISVGGLRGTDQERVYVIARQFFYSVARQTYWKDKQHTLESIAKFVNREHSTVINGLNNHLNDLKNKRYYNDYQRYLEYIGLKDDDIPINIPELIAQRDKQWIEGIEKYYGKMLNPTLLKKIEPK